MDAIEYNYWEDKQRLVYIQTEAAELEREYWKLKLEQIKEK